MQEREERGRAPAIHLRGHGLQGRSLRMRFRTATHGSRSWGALGPSNGSGRQILSVFPAHCTFVRKRTLSERRWDGPSVDKRLAHTRVPPLRLWTVSVSNFPNSATADTFVCIGGSLSAAEFPLLKRLSRSWETRGGWK